MFESPKCNALIIRVLILASFSQLAAVLRSEEHTSELQSRLHLVCRLLLEKNKQNQLRGRAAERRQRQRPAVEHQAALQGSEEPGHYERDRASPSRLTASTHAWRAPEFYLR